MVFFSVIKFFLIVKDPFSGLNYMNCVFALDRKSATLVMAR